MTERLARAEIRCWPRGRFAFVDPIDSDGLSDAAIPISVAITVRDDGSLLRGILSAWCAQCHAELHAFAYYLSVRCVLPREAPNNAGFFRCIAVVVPEASVLNPVPPAACAARVDRLPRVAMLEALAQIVPERGPAAGEGGNSAICISGRRPNGRPFIVVDMVCGAWGGRPDKDGLEAVTNASQNLSNMPVEVMEAEHPVRVEEYALVPDSCGAGRWRGGLGLRRAYRVLAAEALLQLRTDRASFRPYGLAGGGCGGRTRNFIEQNGERRPLPAKVTRRVEGGTLIVHEQAGGGFGPPQLREPARVAEDVADGKITRGYARTQHGVCIDEDGSIDAQQAAQLRAALPPATRRG